MNQESFRHLDAEPSDVRAIKGLRLLLMDVGSRKMPQMFISKNSFDDIEAQLALHAATIPCMFHKGGLSFAFKDINPLNGDLNKLSIIIRSPHAGRAGVRFLSMTHDFKTQLTTGIMLGDTDTENLSSDAGYRLNLGQILALFKSTSDVWEHPTFLAIAMLYMRVDFFNGHSQIIMRNFAELEHLIGITDTRHAETASGSQAPEEWPESVNTKRATVQIHALAYRIILMEDVIKWQRRCTDCLYQLEKVLEKSFPQDTPFRARSQKLQDTLKYISSTSDGMEAVVRSMQQRVQMQLNVLASAASQRDNQINRKQTIIAEKSNRLNIRIATSTKKDSIAMMAFTFITALFLPGTYLASLFSMGMFDWQAGSGSTDQTRSTAVVSNRFWIYWSISAPLTATVMLGWFVWYRVAEVAWRKEAGLPHDLVNTGQNENEA